MSNLMCFGIPVTTVVSILPFYCSLSQIFCLPLFTLIGSSRCYCNKFNSSINTTVSYVKTPLNYVTPGGHTRRGRSHVAGRKEGREQFVYTEHSLWTKLGKAALRCERQRKKHQHKVKIITAVMRVQRFFCYIECFDCCIDDGEPLRCTAGITMGTE